MLFIHTQKTRDADQLCNNFLNPQFLVSSRGGTGFFESKLFQCFRKLLSLQLQVFANWAIKYLGHGMLIKHLMHISLCFSKILLFSVIFSMYHLGLIFFDTCNYFWWYSAKKRDFTKDGCNSWSHFQYEYGHNAKI